MAKARVSKADYGILAAILVLAALLRIIGLNAPLWYDEIFTLTGHVRQPWSDMMSGYSMNYHYLFSLQAKLAVEGLGEAPWTLRLPAMLFGVASIAAFWVLARAAAGRWPAHLTALLIALSYHHIWFSQNARGYTELAFWSAFGTALFLAGLRRPRPGIWAGYALVLTAALYTHLTGAFFFAAHGLLWLGWLAARAAGPGLARAEFWQPALAFAGGLALTILIYLPVLPSLAETVGGVAEAVGADVMQEYRNPLWTLAEGIRTATGGSAAVSGIAVLALALCALGAAGIHTREALIAPLIGLHVIVTLVALSALGMRIWPRFFFTDIGFVLILLVAGVQLVCRWAGRAAGRAGIGFATAPRLFALAALAMALISAGLALRNYTAPKQDLAGAYDFISENRAAEDRSYTVGVIGLVFSGYFPGVWGEISSVAELQAALDAPGRAWLVMGFPDRTTRDHAHLLPALERDFELVREFPGTLGDGGVLVYRSR